MPNFDKALNRLVTDGFDFKFSVYIHDGFELYKKFFGQFAAFYLLIFAVSFLTSMIPYLGYAVDFVFYPVFTAGTLLVANELIKGKAPEFNFFFKGFDFFVPLLILNIVTAILTIVGFVFLIIPGIYLIVAYSFANMFIIFLKYDYWSAMEWSRKVITRRWWQFFGFLLVIGMINIAGLLFCGIGVIFTAPASMCMLFCAFEDIVGGAIKQQDEFLEEQNIDAEIN